jgi:hypothetical protein
MRVCQVYIVLISVLVFNNIGDPSFIQNCWSVAEFVVRVTYDKPMFEPFV